MNDAPAAVISRRTAQSSDASSARIDKLTKRVAREAEFVRSRDAAPEVASTPEPLPRPADRQEVERTAIFARGMLGVHPDEPLTYLSRTVSRVGLMAFAIDLGPDTADGFDLLVSDELMPPELARPYVAAVLRLHRREVISSDRAIDLLLDTWSESDLPELPQLPEQAIWSFV